MAIERIKVNILRECPFCGTEPELIKSSHSPERYYVSCPHCGIEQGYSFDYEDAVEKWNERIKQNA